MLVWDIESLISRGKPLKVYKIEGAFFGGVLHNCNKDGDFVALCTTDDETKLIVWSLKSDKPKKTIKIADDPAYVILGSDSTKRIFIKSANSPSFIVLKESIREKNNLFGSIQNLLPIKKLL